MSDDPSWPRASAWLEGENVPEPTARLGVVGVPLHAASLTPSRSDLATGAVRDALRRFSTYAGDDVDIRTVQATDHGDCSVADLRPEDALDTAMNAVRDALEGRDAVVVLGGDNSVTRPGVHGLGAPLERLGLITLDAHHDLRDTTDGLTNGNPVRALLEDGLPGENVVQIGIQPFANSGAYASVARDAGIRVVTTDAARRDGVARVVSEALAALSDRLDALYVDLDVDVLDRAYAPACPGARPGGLSPWEVQAAARACGAHPKVVGMDVVEVDPERDVADITAMSAASFVLAFAAGLAARSSRTP